MIRYFSKLDHVLDTMKNRRLKVSLPSQLNDPFDFSLAPVGEITKEIAIKMLQERYDKPEFLERFRKRFGSCWSDEKIKDFISNNEIPENLNKSFDKVLKDHYITQTHSIADNHIRLLCFCNNDIVNSGDILMWSHYGNSHKGFRLHFDPSLLNFTVIQKANVDYTKERVQIPASLNTQYPQYDKIMRKSMRTKCECWNYEKEVRFFISSNLCSSSSGKNFIGFSINALKRIDIGMRAEEFEPVQDLLKENNYKHIQLYKSKMHDLNFAIEYEKIMP